MKVNNVTKWIEVDHQASSLFNQIADGRFRETSAGSDKWKSLIDGSVLQTNCNKEGLRGCYDHVRSTSCGNMVCLWLV